MEILELNLKHFGRFTDYRLPLHEGVNVVGGDNETGKSTMHAFIRAMLYGIPRRKRGAGDEYRLRQPWDNPGYFAGTMRLSRKGKVYRIERTFERRNESLSVICETDRTQIQDPENALRAFTCGLSESAFDNTFFVPQRGAATSEELGASIQEYLVNFQESADSAVDVRGALADLKARRRKAASQQNSAAAAIDEAINANRREADFLRAEEQRLQASPQRLQESSEKSTSGDTSVKAWEKGSTAGAAITENAFGASEREKELSAGEDSESREDDADDRTRERASLEWSVMTFLSFIVCALGALCGWFAPDRVRMVLFYSIGALGLLGGIASYREMRQYSGGSGGDSGEYTHNGTDRASLNHSTDAYNPGTGTAEPGQSANTAFSDAVDGQGSAPGGGGSGVSAGDGAASNDAGTPALGDSPAAPELRLAHLAGRKAEVSEQLRNLQERRKRLDTELAELYRKKDEAGGSDREVEALDLAINRIESLSAAISRENGQLFLDTASELLFEFTDGAYDGISFGDDQKVHISSADRFLDLAQVSCATAEQAYFALRCAAGELLEKGSGEHVPLILDEPFAMYDDTRLSETLSYLVRCGRQVILFTSQKRELRELARLKQEGSS